MSDAIKRPRSIPLRRYIYTVSCDCCLCSASLEDFFPLSFQYSTLSSLKVSCFKAHRPLLFPPHCTMCLYQLCKFDLSHRPGSSARKQFASLSPPDPPLSPHLSETFAKSDIMDGCEPKVSRQFIECCLPTRHFLACGPSPVCGKTILTIHYPENLLDIDVTTCFMPQFLRQYTPPYRNKKKKKTKTKTRTIFWSLFRTTLHSD